MDRSGGFEGNKDITEMPAFPDLYNEVFGKMPAGPGVGCAELADAAVRRSRLRRAGAPGVGAGAAGVLRKGFDAAIERSANSSRNR